MKSLGTAACPPYHIAFVIGGTSAEKNLEVVKKASVKYLDELPTTGNKYGRAFRDVELEKNCGRLHATSASERSSEASISHMTFA